MTQKYQSSYSGQKVISCYIKWAYSINLCDIKEYTLLSKYDLSEDKRHVTKKVFNNKPSTA